MLVRSPQQGFNQNPKTPTKRKKSIYQKSDLKDYNIMKTQKLYSADFHNSVVSSSASFSSFGLNLANSSSFVRKELKKASLNS